MNFRAGMVRSLLCLAPGRQAPPVIGVALVATLVASSVSGAQSRVGFRSGFTEGNGIPPRGRVDVDYGSSIIEAGGTRGYSAGEVVAHVPISRRIGVRVHLNSYVWVKTPQGQVAGREDMGIGAAFNVRPNDGWRPATALLTRLDMPSGNMPGQGTAWRPTAKLALSWRLPAELTLASNLGLGARDAQEGRYAQQFGSIWLGRPLAGRVGAFTEVFAFTREAPTGPATQYVRAGLTVLLTQAIHLDVHASTQLGSATPGRIFGIGAKHRL